METPLPHGRAQLRRDPPPRAGDPSRAARPGTPGTEGPRQGTPRARTSLSVFFFCTEEIEKIKVYKFFWQTRKDDAAERKRSHHEKKKKSTQTHLTTIGGFHVKLTLGCGKTRLHHVINRWCQTIRPSALEEEQARREPHRRSHMIFGLRTLALGNLQRN